MAIGIFLGLLVGLRHAFEPDHLTAVSTLVSETHSPRTGALLGVFWGLGHTISLVVVGVVLTLVGATLPPRAGTAFELAVAAMLVALGVRAIVIAVRGTENPHSHLHAHAPLLAHAHPHSHQFPHAHAIGLRRRRRLRPLAVGLVHGLAGSGALTAVVFAQLPGTAARVVYMVLFGAGSIAGMALASGLAGATLALVAGSPRVRRRLAIATGLVSIAVGIAWGVPLVA